MLKIGDRVRVVNYQSNDGGWKNGVTGTIISVPGDHSYFFQVRPSSPGFDPSTGLFTESELEKIELLA